MKEFTIIIKNEKALKILEYLESLNLIEIINPSTKNDKLSLSERMRGSVSPEQAHRLHAELKQMRNEWERF